MISHVRWTRSFVSQDSSLPHVPLRLLSRSHYYFPLRPLPLTCDVTLVRSVFLPPVSPVRRRCMSGRSDYFDDLLPNVTLSPYLVIPPYLVGLLPVEWVLFPSPAGSGCRPSEGLYRPPGVLPSALSSSSWLMDFPGRNTRIRAVRWFLSLSFIVIPVYWELTRLPHRIKHKSCVYFIFFLLTNLYTSTFFFGPVHPFLPVPWWPQKVFGKFLKEIHKEISLVSIESCSIVTEELNSRGEKGRPH